MGPDSATEQQARLLTDRRNRVVLRALEEEGEALHVEELADRLVARDVTVVERESYETELDRVTLTLHHDRLPKLEAAGLIDYDRTATAATARLTTGPADVREVPTLLDALERQLGPNTDRVDDGIGTITGRESVLTYGRQLADEADEELFCIYVRPDLLEDACLCHAENALERGVDLAVGSQNPSVRDLVRNQLPEATIWEPQLDLLNAPTFPRVGRLVLADRRTVMLAVLEDPTDETEETALIGEGEDHPLVLLVRELLGPRLDHLDYQSDEFRSELPS